MHPNVPFYLYLFYKYTNSYATYENTLQQLLSDNNYFHIHLQSSLKIPSDNTVNMYNRIFSTRFCLHAYTHTHTNVHK